LRRITACRVLEPLLRDWRVWSCLKWPKEELFASILEEYDMTPAEWKSIETVELDDAAVIGNTQFHGGTLQSEGGDQKANGRTAGGFLGN
jgi:hypothetical protein